MTLRIDIVSDVVCPWCVIGFKQLERALNWYEAEHGEALAHEVHWQPFQLNPGMPAEGQNVNEHLEMKYGPSAGKRGTGGLLRELGEELGFDFKLNAQSRIYNTEDAHMLLSWAAEQGCQTELKLALFKAYFSDGRDISDHEVLLGLVAQLGLDQTAAINVLSDAARRQALAERQAYWRDNDVHAVPAYSFNKGHVLVGSLDSRQLLRMFNRQRTA